MKKYLLVVVGLIVGSSLLWADVIGDRGISAGHFVGGSSFFGRDFDDDDDNGFGRYFERALERAGASESQIEKIEELVESNRDAQQQQHRQLEDLERDIRAELRRDNPNRTTLENLIRQAGAIRTQLTITGVNTRLEIQQILGNEIWDELDDEHGNRERGNWRRRRR